MKHTIYEDPATQKFAIIEVPPTFADGDTLPIPSSVRWFDTREEAIATLPDLFDLDE